MPDSERLTEFPPPASQRRLRVGVLVDLELTPSAGGHVKCWERLSRAATTTVHELDLTVHFMGRESRVETLTDGVRYVLEPPVFSTARLPFLSHVPEHTDLAPRHPRLAAHLAHYDVIHTTDAYFAYARTATAVARARGIPMTTSVHTNTPEYARIFTGQTVERLAGKGMLGRFLLDRVGVARNVERKMLRQLREHQERCAFTFVSRPDQLEAARAQLGDRVGLLRRGIDRRHFDPAKRDRAWLETRFGVPRDRLVVLFVGRLNRGKNVLLLVEALAMLRAQGLPVHLFCAGEGDERATIVARLGDHATCPGTVSAEDLANVYAAADLFGFPSQIEEYANVVLEALSSGLPALVSRRGGMGRVFVDGTTGTVLPGDDPAPWALAIAALHRDPARRRAMGQAARAHADRHLPSWRDVLVEDLLPRWRAAAGRPLAVAGVASAA